MNEHLKSKPPVLKRQRPRQIAATTKVNLELLTLMNSAFNPTATAGISFASPQTAAPVVDNLSND